MDAEQSHSIAQRAAAALMSAKAPIATVGLDGFVDHIIRVVDERHAPGREGFVPMSSMRQMATRIEQAAGRSANIELIVERTKMGGNGPLMAQALASLDAQVRYIGAIGREDGHGAHPAFDAFASGCERVCFTGPPGSTDAIEFDDGKIMLGRIEPMERLSFEAMVDAAGGLDELAQLFDGASIIAMNNWTMIPTMNAIWRSFLDEVTPRLSVNPARRFFVDLADPAKRSSGHLQEAIRILESFEEAMPVTLGLNRAEADRVMQLLDAPAEGASSMDLAHAIRTTTGLSTVVVHDRRGAGAAQASEMASMAGPYVASPMISTGAGDHFNAGFAFGQAIGLALEESLALGVGVSGKYVRSSAAPSRTELAAFLSDLPTPE